MSAAKKKDIVEANKFLLRKTKGKKERKKKGASSSVTVANQLVNWKECTVMSRVEMNGWFILGDCAEKLGNNRWHMV